MYLAENILSNWAWIYENMKSNMDVKFEFFLTWHPPNCFLYWCVGWEVRTHCILKTWNFSDNSRGGTSNTSYDFISRSIRTRLTQLKRGIMLLFIDSFLEDFHARMLYFLFKKPHFRCHLHRFVYLGYM